MSQPGFSFGERIGLLFTVEAATLSICAVTLILCYALYKWVRTWGHSELKNSEASDSILFLNLMLADLIQGLGAMPNIKWLSEGYILGGELCTAQAVLKQVGIVGVAMTSLAIAFYTFIVLALRKDRALPEHTAKVVVLGIWIFVAIVIGIPNIVNRNDQYYGPTDFWCWILPTHELDQIMSEYLWVWSAAFVMLLLYPIMFLLMRGWIGNKEADDSRTDLQSPGRLVIPEDMRQVEANLTKRVAKKMLYYPAIYIVCTLPNSASRWMEFRKLNPSYQFVLGAQTLYSLSGLFNFFLFLFTRPSWVIGSRRREERSEPLRGHHGILLPETPGHPSRMPDYERLSGDIGRYDDVSIPLSPQSLASRSLPHEKLVSSTSGHDDDYGFLPPGRG